MRLRGIHEIDPVLVWEATSFGLGIKLAGLPGAGREATVAGFLPLAWRQKAIGAVYAPRITSSF
jgi:hypothetical protein